MATALEGVDLLISKTFVVKGNIYGEVNKDFIDACLTRRLSLPLFQYFFESSEGKVGAENQ
jgi:hypothetical protein